VKSLQKIVEASKYTLNNPAHCVGDRKCSVRRPLPQNSFDGDGLDAKLVKVSVVAAWHSSCLFQCHTHQGVERPVINREALIGC